jgi:pimeloyl-ACP methyl ester carboxylesterase
MMPEPPRDNPAGPGKVSSKSSILAPLSSRDTVQTLSGDYVRGRWRYAEISGASHWIPLDAPDELNALLTEWLSQPA